VLGEYRAALCVPLLREGMVIGVFALSRKTAGYFTSRQVELVESFADQAVIAIENVRLFGEVQRRNRETAEALEQQTATAEVLRVTAASPTDIQPVLDAVVRSAARLCGAHDAIIRLRKDNTLVLGAHFGPIPVDQVAIWPLSRDQVIGRAVIDAAVVQVPDI